LPDGRVTEVSKFAGWVPAAYRSLTSAWDSGLPKNDASAIDPWK
jgi:hypothetical protein